jgi:hypothetical protein
MHTFRNTNELVDVCSPAALVSHKEEEVEAHEIREEEQEEEQSSEKGQVHSYNIHLNV